MAERFNAAVLKTAEPETVPWVRIPLSPRRKLPFNAWRQFSLATGMQSTHALDGTPVYRLRVRDVVDFRWPFFAAPYAPKVLACRENRMLDIGLLR
jgi:hypothetical protein